MTDGTPLGFVRASTLYDPVTGQQTGRAEALRQTWAEIGRADQ